MLALRRAISFILRKTRRRNGRGSGESDPKDVRPARDTDDCVGNISEPGICTTPRCDKEVSRDPVCPSPDHEDSTELQISDSASDPSKDNPEASVSPDVPVTDTSDRTSTEGIQHASAAEVPEPSKVWVEFTLEEEINMIQTPQEENTDIIAGYKVSSKLGKGRFGPIFAASRLKDGLQVALKVVPVYRSRFIEIDGRPVLRPKEVSLQILANRGPPVPEILRLLDWHMRSRYFIIVLEHPMPCQTLHEFLLSRGPVKEDVARVIMSQVVHASQICCKRGVLHRDIQPRNILINPETLQCKLFDFGCGEFMSTKSYKDYPGALHYCPPEYVKHHKYHAEPTSVWLLGVLLFHMLLKDPSREDLHRVKAVTRARKDLSKECCKFIWSCLKTNPKKRLDLKTLHYHKWFMLPTEQRTTESVS
ncbi:hypothetical protein DNTS_007579 [Danionella cerebrum]|uniref:non-specific serine/threonine protein kinase n=1 Tax=Danionella cerebrum TaxID=2873325 RepID=A0A553R330_9TELE|nr:hypothetical protein DNTS_007579 [Danionella translucida]